MVVRTFCSQHYKRNTSHVFLRICLQTPLFLLFIEYLCYSRHVLVWIWCGRSMKLKVSHNYPDFKPCETENTRWITVCKNTLNRVYKQKWNVLNLTWINIGMGFQRCLELQDLKGLKSDPEMATLLLNKMFYFTLYLYMFLTLAWVHSLTMV